MTLDSKGRFFTFFFISSQWVKEFWLEEGSRTLTPPFRNQSEGRDVVKDGWPDLMTSDVQTSVYCSIRVLGSILILQD